MQIKKEDIKITCKDQFNLTGSIYRPETAKGAIMIGPATGIKRGFYNGIATYLAENNYGVITFDNRGIGDSRVDGELPSNASLINWGALDMSAVLDRLKTEFPGVSYHLLGHSAGGQLLGLMSNSQDLKSLFNFASSSGSLRNMEYPFKLQAHFFMNVFIPLSNMIFGQTNSHWMGMGEVLPKEVAYQWSKWCNGTGYVAMDFGDAIKSHNFNELTLPSKWVHATDDEIANLANVKDMIRIFPNSKAVILSLNPKELGIKDLGHMKFFSSKNKELWTHALDWFDQQTV